MFRFSEWSEHSLPSVLPQSYPLPYSNSRWLALQGMRVGVAAAVKWNQDVAVAVNLWEHRLGVLASMTDWDDSSSLDCRCSHMERLLVAYFDPLCLPVLASNPLLREQLGSSLLGD